MQFHIPSVVHGVPAAIADPEPATGAGAGEAIGVGFEATALEAATGGGGATVAWLGAEVATVTNTPPDGTGADVGTGATEFAGGLPDPDPLAAPVGHVPAGATGVAVFKPSFSSESPGFGKARSVLSIVLQPFPMFAVNISGSAL